MRKIGIIGAGQLGQMLGFAAHRLDAECVFLDPAPNPPASAAGPVIALPFDSRDGLAELARRVDVITYEFENVPIDALALLPEDVPVYPSPSALENSQDRLAEKKLLESLRIPVPAYRAVDSRADLQRAVGELGLPLVLKTRRLGYDGKGQFLLKSPPQIDDALNQLGPASLIAEEWVAFDCEVSAIGARGSDGEWVRYALTENRHRDGMLRVSRAPADLPKVSETAGAYLQSLLQALDYVGVLALEMFVAGDRLFANEFAPRVHNSGHWTIEGARTSQFENHLRAVLGLPLGDPSCVGHAGMVNLIGSMPELSSLAALPHTGIHDYGKKPRPNRKLGHVTLVAQDPRQRDEGLKLLERAVAGG